MRRVALAVGLGLALYIAASPTHAAEPSASEIAAAREQFLRGVEEAKAGRWETAREAFQRAFNLTERPQILLNLAGALSKTQRLVEAIEAYRRFLREAPNMLAHRHRTRIEQLVTDLDGRIPRVIVEVPHWTPKDRVFMDGQELAPAAWGLELPVNPGSHTFALKRNGIEKATQTILLEPGSQRTVTLAVPQFASSTADHHDDLTPNPSGPEGAVAQAADRPERSVSPWWWVAGGIAIVAGAAVTIGLLVTDEDSDLYGGTTGVVVRGATARW